MIPALRGRGGVIAGVLTLLAAHIALAWSSALGRSVCVDEIYHLTGGFLFDKVGDYRIHPDNGVLPQRLQALPAVLMGAKPPPFAGNDYWRVSDVSVVCHQFFYESGNDHWPLLLAARAMSLLFSVGVCLMCFGWARRLAGTAAGFVALGLAALSPTLLAHGPMVTTDVASALALGASVGLFWWQLRRGGWARALASAAVFGAACVTKYSAVLLIPIFLLLIAIDRGAGRNETPRSVRGSWIAGSVALHAAIATLIIWACFGFRYRAFAPGVASADHFVRSWDWMMGQIGWQGRVVAWLRDHQLLPEGFLFGYTHTYVGSLQRGAFLAGDYRTTGWPQFFPLAFLWKSTPAELSGLLSALLLMALRWRRLRPWLLRAAPLVALLVVYGGIAVTSHLNIGQRHLLPLYPPLFIGIGVAVTRLRRATLAGGALLVAQAVSAATIHPFEIAYFNAFAGGPDRAWRLLVDSSLDWGQDLGRLKTWLDAHHAGPQAQPVFLSYFGSGEPGYYGLRAERLMFINGFKFPLAWYEPKAGLYCISATTLQEVYSPVNGPWTPEREAEYQRWRRFDPQFRDFYTNPAAKPALLAAFTAEQWENAWRRYEWLREARLFAYLRARGPDDNIGHSILIFRVSEAELRAALHSPYSEWAEAVTAAAKAR